MIDVIIGDFGIEEVFVAASYGVVHRNKLYPKIYDIVLVKACIDDDAGFFFRTYVLKLRNILRELYMQHCIYYMVIIN